MPTFVYLKNGQEVDRLLGADENAIRNFLNKNK
jgi:thioredoxin-like negative regulator of GroEL